MAPFLRLCLSFVILGILAKKSKGVEMCPSREITSSTGEVVSHLGSAYVLGVDCTLTINTDPGMRFKIELEDLAIEPNPDVDRFDPDKCKSNALVIKTGSRDYIRCGLLDDYEEDYSFTTVGNQLILRFFTDKSEILNRDHFDGFSLSYSTEKQPVTKVDGESICPARHIKRKRSGIIFSPNFPQNYPDNQDCQLRVSIPDNFQMNVWFQDFSLQKSPACQNDWLSVTDEHGGHKMCGGGKNKLPGLQEFKGHLAKIRFLSDSSLTKEGFRLHYNMTRLQEGHCMCTTGSTYICMINFHHKMRRLWHRIKFYIKTSQSNGLIMFSKGKLRDYIYIGIYEGNLFYRSDLGTGSNMIIVESIKINDNAWHYVEIRRRERLLTIDVDNGRARGEAKTKGNFNKIDLPKSIGFFLGTPPQVQAIPNFIGCIRDFTVDGREPLTNAFVDKPQYPGHGMDSMTLCPR